MSKEYNQFKNNLSLEQDKQSFFNNLYKKLGYEVVNRNHCKEYDLVLSKAGKEYTVEEKARRGNFNDILVETIQDEEKNYPGWIYYTKADYIVYGIFGRDSKVYGLNCPEFKDWFAQAMLGFEKKISNKGYGKSTNYVVPISYIPPEIISRLY